MQGKTRANNLDPARLVRSSLPIVASAALAAGSHRTSFPAVLGSLPRWSASLFAAWATLGWGCREAS